MEFLGKDPLNYVEQIRTVGRLELSEKTHGLKTEHPPLRISVDPRIPVLTPYPNRGSVIPLKVFSVQGRFYRDGQRSNPLDKGGTPPYKRLFPFPAEKSTSTRIIDMNFD